MAELQARQKSRIKIGWLYIENSTEILWLQFWIIRTGPLGSLLLKGQ